MLAATSVGSHDWAKQLIYQQQVDLEDETSPGPLQKLCGTVANANEEERADAVAFFYDLLSWYRLDYISLEELASYNLNNYGGYAVFAILLALGADSEVVTSKIGFVSVDRLIKKIDSAEDARAEVRYKVYFRESLTVKMLRHCRYPI
jgi:hypothetical protein